MSVINMLTVLAQINTSLEKQNWKDTEKYSK